MSTKPIGTPLGCALCFLAVLCCGPGESLAQTWTTQLSGTPSRLDAVSFLSTSKVVAVGRKNGANFTAIFSTNGGTVWNNATIGGGAPASQDLKALAFNGATGISVGKKAVILRSTDSGASWDIPATNPAPAGIDLEALAFNGATVIAVGKRNGAEFNIVRSTDSGANWAVPTFPAGGNQDLKAVVFVDAATVVAVGKAGTILRSTDGGANWVDRSGVTLQELSALAVSGTTIIAVGKKSGVPSFTLVRSTDGGANWAAATVVGGTAQDLKKVIFVNSTTAVAAGKRDGANFTILRSTDSGANWVLPATLPGGGQDLEAMASKGSFVIAVGKAGTILASTDEGSNWSSQNSGSANDLKAVSIVNPVIAVGATGEVLLSTDQPTSLLGLSAIGGGVSRPIPVGGEWIVALVFFACGAYRLQRRPRV